LLDSLLQETHAADLKMSSGSVINHYTNVGFGKAPVSKSLMLVVGCSHAASHVPSFATIFRKIFTGPISLDSSGNIVRLVASKLVFPDTRSTILALFLIYFFRIFERRCGSLKFSSNLLTSWLLGLSFDILISSVIPESWSPLLTPGPLSLVLPLFVPFYLRVPLTSSAQFGPVPVSTKSLPYLLGLQIALHSPGTIATTLSCLLVGWFVHCTCVGGIIALPRPVGKLFSSTLGWLIDSSPSSPPSSSHLLGATLEIQRTQQAEAMEQQLLRARARQFNVPIGGRQMRLDEMWRQGAGGGGGGRAAQAPAAPVQPSPVMVQALTDMGFPRQRVEQALIRANNDMDQATNFLLQDI